MDHCGANERLIAVVGPAGTWNPYGPQQRAGEVSTSPMVVACFLELWTARREVRRLAATVDICGVEQVLLRHNSLTRGRGPPMRSIPTLSLDSSSSYR